MSELNKFGEEVLNKYTIPVRRKINILIFLITFIILEALNLTYVIFINMGVAYLVSRIITFTAASLIIALAAGYLFGSIIEVRYEYVVRITDPNIISRISSHYDIVESSGDVYIIRKG